MPKPNFSVGLPAFLVLAALPFSSPAYSQAVNQANPANRESSNQGSLRVDANMVLVPVTVSDGLDRPIMGLDRQSFTLYEDDRRQEIRYFSTEDAPISVELLLDLSKSMTNKFLTEQNAVSAFFNNANSRDDYLVISFSDRPRVVANSTQSINAIEASIAAQKPGGNTALLDAVSFGESRMLSAQYRRRALLIISDGGDNHSRHRLRQIKKLVQDSDAEVYALGVFDTGPFKSFEEFMGKRWLDEITNPSGGETVAVNNLSSLSEAAAALSRKMRDRYVIGYFPSSGLRDNHRRKISLQIKTSGSVKPVHAYYKTGYLPQVDRQ